MGTNRRKAVKDKKKHRARVQELRTKKREAIAQKVADRLMGKRGVWVQLPQVGKYPATISESYWDGNAREIK